MELRYARRQFRTRSRLLRKALTAWLGGCADGDLAARPRSRFYPQRKGPGSTSEPVSPTASQYSRATSPTSPKTPMSPTSATSPTSPKSPYRTPKKAISSSSSSRVPPQAVLEKTAFFKMLKTEATTSKSNQEPLSPGSAALGSQSWERSVRSAFLETLSEVSSPRKK